MLPCGCQALDLSHEGACCCLSRLAGCGVEAVAAACASQTRTCSLGLSGCSPTHVVQRGPASAGAERGVHTTKLGLAEPDTTHTLEHRSANAGANKGVHTLKREIRARFNIPPEDTIKRPVSAGRGAEGARKQSPPVSPVLRHHDCRWFILVKRSVAQQSALGLLKPSAGGPVAAVCE